MMMDWLMRSITYTINVDAQPISLEVRTGDHKFFHLVIDQQFVQPAAGQLSALEFALQEKFIVRFFKFNFLDIAPNFVGDEQLEFLAFVPIVVADADQPHVDSDHDITTDPEFLHFLVVLL